MNPVSKRDNQVDSRRLFLKQVFRGSFSIFAGASVLSCERQKPNEKASTVNGAASNPSDCNDLATLTKDEIALRDKLGYVQESPLPDNQCQNCNLFLPPKEGHKCGGCMLFKGPVFVQAYCTYWAPRL